MPPSRLSLFPVILVVASFAASTGTVRAADECIVKPNAQPPQGQHWYYRTDRDSNRQCWYLGPEGLGVRTGAPDTLKQFDADASATPAAPVRPSPDAANLNQQQREALFRQFIEWRQSHRERQAQ